MKTIAIANQKGGTAKTTTAAALAVLLSRSGVPVHIVDMDPQASLTRAFGQADPSDRLYHSLMNRAGLPIVSVAPNLTLTPSSIALTGAETELLTERGREAFLKSSLEKTTLPPNAIVILDCPPSLGVLAVNCLTAAGGLIAVIQPGGFELHALVHLHMTLQVIQQRANPDLTILGAIVTNAHQRRLITGKVIAEVSRLYRVLGEVRCDARMLYATSSGMMHELRNSKALDDYGKIVETLLAEIL